MRGDIKRNTQLLIFLQKSITKRSQKDLIITDAAN